MSELAGLGAAMPPLQPPDAGAADPGSANGAAFSALFASLGYPTLQNPAPQALLPPATIGREGGAGGNIVPQSALDLSGAIARRMIGERIAGSPASAAQETAARRIDGFAGSLSERPNSGLPFDDPELAARVPFDLLALRTKIGSDQLATQTLPQADVADDLLSQTAALRTSSGPGDIPVPGATVAAAAPGAANPTVATDAPVPLHHPRFAEAFGHQVTVMARDGIQHARISINPPELGPVELRIVVRNDEASVHLAATHAAVRDVLEQSLPRLREQFEQAGMQLSDSAVYAQLPGGTGGHGREREAMAAAYGADPLSLTDIPPPQAVAIQLGLVDTYI